MSRNKLLAILVILAFAMSAAFAGCGSPENKGSQDATTAAQTQAATTEAPKKDPVKLTMFFGDGGIVFPSDVDPGNNPIINIVEKLANVDLDITKPEIADFQTKFNLLMSSGEVPDIVHSWFEADVNKFGKAGAFLALDDLIANSPVLSQFHSKIALDATRADDGKIYGLFAQPAEPGQTAVARIDLINELNGGVVPATPEEWYELMKKEKAKYPDSVPYSTLGNLNLFGLEIFFDAYGAKVGYSGGTQWQVYGDKVLNAFETPMMKEAVLFHQKLYKEKLLDPNFATNQWADRQDRILNRNMLIMNGASWAIHMNMEEWLKNNSTKGEVLGYVPNPVAPGVDQKVAYPQSAVKGFHMLSISANCPDKEAAVKTLEAFISPELKQAVSWGIEGTHYTVKDGKNELNIDQSTKDNWRVAYGFMWQYWFDESLDVKNLQLVNRFPQESTKTLFLDTWAKGMEIRKKQYDASGPAIIDLFKKDTDTTNKMVEAANLSTAIILKAMTGSITMDEYDKQVKDFLEKYKGVTEAYQKWYDAQK